jgi:uncharacterized membrane protein
MNTIGKQRINSIDLLKGLAMVVMALDHVRDYFHYSAFVFDPADPLQSNLPLFFTRWITHFCAPIFSFLAGVSAFMVGRRKNKKELSGFLIKRGIWLIFLELTVIGFGWFFDIHFGTFVFVTIWSLGVSMLVLAAMIHLPRTAILCICLILIGGHNLLDTVHFEESILWASLHEFSMFKLNDTTNLLIGYPVMPWIAIMSLGYYFGSFYDTNFDGRVRKKIFNRIGFIAIGLFLILRFTNFYGDAYHFTKYGSVAKDIISFFNPTKYPPSLQYILMTLGAAFVLLANIEKLKGKVVDFFCTFGRVPFFYYILHLYLIHVLAMLFAQLAGFGWRSMLLPTWISFAPGLKGYGFSLWVVYLVWSGVIVTLYPLCVKYDQYKQAHKEKWWLSYL